MNPKNKAKSDYLRLTSSPWQDYDGSGIVIAVWEDTSSGHGKGSLDTIRQLAPGARVLSRKRPGVRIVNGKLTPETIATHTAYYREQIAEGVSIVTMSVYGGDYADLAALQRRMLVEEGGVTLLTAAGNDSANIDPSAAGYYDDTWLAVGAAYLINGKPMRAHYSNKGPHLDVLMFEGWANDDGIVFAGTSSASPALAACLARYHQWYLETYGRTPTREESCEFIRANCEDLGDAGRDNLTGWGIFRMPEDLPSSGRPRIYLSPSTQAANVGVGDYGTEEYRMRQLAWKVGELCTRQGADVAIARVDLEPDGCVVESNAYQPRYHISLHSNSNGRGVEGFHWPGSVTGRALTEDICNALAPLNPNGLRRVEANGSFTEIAGPNAYCAYIEVGFHDRPEEAQWIVRDMDLIALTIARVICRHLGLPEPDDWVTERLAVAEAKLAEIRRITAI
jgi:N-acetylmuramoyl-L-alanine amidase